jgi:hypothetical protein
MSKVITFTRPHYPYLETLKKVNNIIEDLADEFDGDRRAGIAVWKRNYYDIADGCYVDFFKRTEIY